MKIKIKTLILSVLTLSFIFGSTMKAEDLTVEIDLEEQGADINPFIYGQFIEHMGRCIYGGIWAEMLEDRKFYFPVTENYAPYVKYVDTDYPVVGSSPWQITGAAGGVEMVKENSFVGDHTPKVSEGTGIQQNDLGVVEGKAYEGYVWLKSANRAKVKVTFTTGEGKASSKKFTVSGKHYKKMSFEFDAYSTTDEAALKVEVLDGEVLIGTVSIMPNDNIKGMRKDTIDLLKEMNSPIYRWPGGNFVSGYEWRDGIGDRDRRPPRKNPAWTGVEHNDFGTDEFIAFCREINTEPMIAANTGYGDAHSAAEWVDYCNAGADTTGGSYRIEGGTKKPFNVKYWCVGNEMFGQWQLGFMQLNHYTIKHNLVARTMWEADPDLVLVGVGDINAINDGYDPDSVENNRTWSMGMLEDSSEWMDLLSEHYYVGRLPWEENPRSPVLEHVTMHKDAIRERVKAHLELQASMEHLNGEFMPISMDEWNYWHRDYVYGELGCIYDLQDALGIAMGLHEYYRQSKYIHMASYAQTVNVIGAIKTSKTEAQFATTGLVLKLYTNHFGSRPLKFDGELGDCDIMAALNEAGDVMTLSVVNPTREEVVVNLNGMDLPQSAQLYVITGENDASYNLVGEQREVDIDDKGEVSLSGGFKAQPLSASLWEIRL